VLAAAVKVQVVVIHEGVALGANPIGGVAGSAWQGPIAGIVDTRSRRPVRATRCSTTSPLRSPVAPAVEGRVVKG
jgi:hypothetical protein